MKRFWNKINVGGEDECWEWTAATRSGYGAIKIDGSVVSAHRLSWRFEHGKIPDGLYICHHCDNRLCCNPQHLFLGTASDNAKDAYEKDRLYIPDASEKARGSNVTEAKLNEQKVSIIKSLLKRGNLKQTEIAKMFGVHKSQISRIKNEKTWQHV